MCDKLGLVPEETVFIDDNEKNIKASIEFGIKGYLFNGNAEALMEYLKGELR